RIGVDDRQGELALKILRRRDAVATLLDEEVGPFLQPVVVESVNVAGEKVLDGELKRDVHGPTSPYARGTVSTGHAPRPRSHGTRSTRPHARPFHPPNRAPT